MTPLDEFMGKALADGLLAITMLAKAHAVAASHGGECLSEYYIDCHGDLDFKCKFGHPFTTDLASVNEADHPRPRILPPECGGTRKRTFDENAELVAPSGYTLLEMNTAEMGKTKVKKVTNFRLRCPSKLHEFDMKRDNFLPVGYRRGPAEAARNALCASASQEKSKRERRARALLFGLVPSDPGAPYVPRNVAESWRCLAGNHTFEVSWNTLLFRDPGRKCLKCAP